MAKFIIKNSDNYGEKGYEIVRGKILTFDNKTLYTYYSKLGKCELICTEKSIILSRNGEYSTFIEINVDKKTEFIYKMNGINQKLTVKGSLIQEDKIKQILKFKYKIFDFDTEINEIEIQIKKLSN